MVLPGKNGVVGKGRAAGGEVIVPDGPSWLRKGFPLLWFALVAFLLFGWSISYDFTYFDDHTLILNRMDQLRNSSGIQQAFGEDVFHSPAGQGHYYRPVLTLTFMTDAMLGGGSFAMFHFSNIVYHILATFLLFLVLLSLGAGRLPSFVFSMLFLVHPLVAQVVAWVPGRNDSLLAIFVLGSFLSWLKYYRDGGVAFLLIHLLLYLGALFTKENALLLPFLILLYAFLATPRHLKRIPLALTGWLILSVIWAMIRARALGETPGLPFPEVAVTFVKNLPAIFSYFGKTFVPVRLSVFPVMADLKPAIVSGIAAAVLFFAVVLFRRNQTRWPLVILGTAWFVAFLLPSFLTFGSQVANFSEHRNYLSMTGILIALTGTGPIRTADFRRPVPLALAGIVFVLFFLLTFLHSGNFRDRFTLWQKAVDSSPSSAFSCNNLGAMFYLSGDLVKAESLFRQAIRINPSEPMANGNLGLVCMKTDRDEEAERFYFEEIRVNPGWDDAYYNLGLLYVKQSRFEEAIGAWEKTIEVNPRNVGAYQILLQTFEYLKRPEDYQRILSQARERGLTEGD